jgi:hypothetical protein
MTEGTKTSEAIATAVGMIVSSGYGVADADPTVRAASVIAIGILGAAYTISRGIRKGGKQA